MRHQLLAYDRDKHGAFVLTSWQGRTTNPSLPGYGRPPMRPRHVMADLLRRPDVRCVVAAHHEDAGELYGWAAKQDDAILWAFVRDIYGRLRRKGLMTSMLLELGFDLTQPTPCRFWSGDAAAIAAGGLRIYYAPHGAVERAIA